ncbi:hypothetical protein [Xanthomonas oryzae]|uniref:hypothetical protein n=1 Tax=Xanthomonas oryzae TaxID=347 RepID=UPI0002D4DFEE|nr:hypothetical protein [Xanthomonas oryzae]
MTHKTILNAAILAALACLMPAAYAEDDVAETAQPADDTAPSWTLTPVEVTATRGAYTTPTTDTPSVS